MTRSEEIFLERCKHHVGVLTEWRNSPNLTPEMSECIEILSDTMARIEIKLEIEK